MRSKKFKKIFPILILGLCITVFSIIFKDFSSPNNIDIGGDPIDIIEPDRIGPEFKI